MKYLFLLTLLISTPVLAQQTCSIETKTQEVTTPVPQGLEGSTIIVRTKDGKEYTMKSEEFKVVKRKQVKVSEVEQCNTVVAAVEHKEKLNLLIAGLSRDYTGVSSEQSSSGSTKTVTLYSNKGLVGDLGYMRRRLFDTNFAGGVSLNTNLAPRISLGYEF